MESNEIIASNFNLKTLANPFFLFLMKVNYFHYITMFCNCQEKNMNHPDSNLDSA